MESPVVNAYKEFKHYMHVFNKYLKAKRIGLDIRIEEVKYGFNNLTREYAPNYIEMVAPIIHVDVNNRDNLKLFESFFTAALTEVCSKHDLQVIVQWGNGTDSDECAYRVLPIFKQYHCGSRVLIGPENVYGTVAMTPVL